MLVLLFADTLFVALVPFLYHDGIDYFLWATIVLMNCLYFLNPNQNMNQAINKRCLKIEYYEIVQTI
jgi:hypothetical protein